MIGAGVETQLNRNARLCQSRSKGEVFPNKQIDGAYSKETWRKPFQRFHNCRGGIATYYREPAKIAIPAKAVGLGRPNMLPEPRRGFGAMIEHRVEQRHEHGAGTATVSG